MDASIFVLLAQDGITNGAIYILIALALVLIFSVTRIIYIPQGEFVSWGALTLASLEMGGFPQAVVVLILLGISTFCLDMYHTRRIWKKSLFTNIIYPIVVGVLLYITPIESLPFFSKVIITLAIITPLGPMLYRLVYQPLAQASVLILLIVSVALHFVLLGIGLFIFGPEGYRTSGWSEQSYEWGILQLGGHNIWVMSICVLLVVSLYLYFRHTISGKALQATAINRTGARLMGIGTNAAGKNTFMLAAFIGGLSGVLIAPITTIFYDSGFLIGLKGFVAAIMGGLSSFVLAAGGAILVGLLESFFAFWSSAYKDVLVFAMIIPVLIWLSFSTKQIEEEDTHIPVIMTHDKGWIDPRIVLTIFVGLVILAPFILSDYYITVINYIAIAALVTTGLILLTGVGGLTSFGQAAFVGVGAYTTAWLTTSNALDPWLGSMGSSAWLGLVLGLIATLVIALLLGSITLKLSGHYLPLGTMAWGISLFFLLGNLDFLGGHGGISNIPGVNFFGFVLLENRHFYFLIWAFVFLAILTTRNLLNSREGRSIRALKGGVIMAEAMGVNTSRSKIIIFILAALHASAAGWLYAHMQRFVNPSPFSLQMGIEYLFMAVLGGTTQVWSAIVGSGIIIGLDEQLQNIVPLLFGTSGNFEVIVFGILLIIILHYARDGIFPLLERWIPIAHKQQVINPNAGSLPKSSQPEKGSILLEVQSVTKKFGGLIANNKISFQVTAGEILGLIGPNGAGKSTLFNQLSGVDSPTEGTILFKNKKISDLASRSIAALGLSRTFQHVRIIPHMSVLDNVAIGAYRRGRKGIFAAAWNWNKREEQTILREAALQLERVGLAELMHVPAGTLSLGQQRILEIARSLCADPCLLLLDEPAAGLRVHEKTALSTLLMRLKEEGISVLIVEHDMDFIMNLVDRIVVMEFGEKIAEGLPQEIQSNPKVLAAYLGVIE